MIRHHLIFKAIVGSQAYGLATPTSDVDIKGVYIQSNDELLQSGMYEPHIQVTKDEVYYELRNFLELLASGNPMAIELLATPKECVLYSSQLFEQIIEYKTHFITKKLYDSFGGYALAQLKKAQGLNKKFNWEQSRIEKKEIIDFCRLLGRPVGRVMPLKQYLSQVGVNQAEIGLTKIEGFRDSYKLYLPPNPAVEGVIYRGVQKEGSNEVRTSVVPKVYADDWIGVVYFNREAYSTHCRDYKSYRKWLDSRNEARYRESREGQQYDSKNIMHTARLIMTIENIHNTSEINVDMSKVRDYLLDIKHGNVDLEKVFEEFSKRAKNISELKAESPFPDELSPNFTRLLEFEIRNLNEKQKYYKSSENIKGH